MKYNLINTLEKKWNAIIRTLLLFLPLFQFVVLISSVWGVKRLPRVSYPDVSMHAPNYCLSRQQGAALFTKCSRHSSNSVIS